MVFIYTCVGVFGYFTFYDALEGNLLVNYTDDSNIYIVLVKVGLSVVLVFSAPLFLPPLRHTLYRYAQTLNTGLFEERVRLVVNLKNKRTTYTAIK